MTRIVFVLISSIFVNSSAFAALPGPESDTSQKQTVVVLDRSTGEACKINIRSAGEFRGAQILESGKMDGDTKALAQRVSDVSRIESCSAETKASVKDDVAAIQNGNQSAFVGPLFTAGVAAASAWFALCYEVDSHFTLDSSNSGTNCIDPVTRNVCYPYILGKRAYVFTRVLAGYSDPRPECH